MSEMITEYYANICCEDAVRVVDGEICDTYGGNECLKDVVVCKRHKRAFAEYSGGRFSGVEEIEYREDEVY